MSKKTVALLSGLGGILAVTLMVGCAASGGSVVVTPPPTSTPTGSVVTFATDAPICDVESFVVTITSASLVPQAGGTPVALITSTTPATVDFARLTDFTTMLGAATTVQAGTYSGLQVTLTNPQLVVLNTSTSPPTPQTVPVSLTTTTPTFTISPALVVSSDATSGLVVNLNLLNSLQVDGTGQVTGTVDPQMIVTATNSSSGSVVGSADSLYGILQSVSTTNLPSGFTGSFAFALHDGTGQTLTVLSNSSTVFEGDGVASFSDLAANTFVDVSVSINSSGQIIARTVDAEEQTSTVSQRSAFLGRIINVTRLGVGNATAFTLLVDDEIPDLSNVVPLHSTLNITLAGTVDYLTGAAEWNRQGFTFGPQTVGLAEKVALFGVLQAGSTLAADHVFLRPQNVLGNFQTLQQAGTDGKTGGFTMIPCGGLFAGQAITAVTYSDTYFTGVSGLTGLAPTPILDTTGLLSYQLTSGTTTGGASWIAPTWVIQAIGVHQPPN
ncbi:MAG: DUF4382 domain-containing protein [Terriglobia bacterium]